MAQSPSGSSLTLGAAPDSSVGSVANLRTGGRWFDPRHGQYSFRELISHCGRIHSSLSDVHCFGNSYVGKQLVVWKEYFAEYWLKELQESMDRCDITEILLKTALNTIQSINQSINITICNRTQSRFVRIESIFGPCSGKRGLKASSWPKISYYVIKGL